MHRNVACLATLVALCSGCSRTSSLPPPPPPVDGTIAVDATSAGASVPDDFLGISAEWWVVPILLGDGKGGPQPLSVALAGAFEAEGHRLAVRVGGNSADRAWWNPDGSPAPPGIDVDVTDAHLRALRAFHAALGARFVLGLDLALDDTANATALAQAALATVGADAIDAFEIGNEPDRYASTGARPADYDFSSYVPELERFHDAVAGGLPAGQAFAGPALASRRLLPQLLPFAHQEKPRLALVTTHAYGLPGCGGAMYGPDDLLTDAATQIVVNAYAPLVASAHADGQRLRMAETNSVSCGGASGVSDVYASALWGADLALSLASIGYDGMNFHMPGTYSAWDWTVHPLYYGMRFASLATARHGRPLATTVDAPGRVRAWATLGDDGAIRLAVLNEQARPVSLRVPVSARGAPTLVRLHAPAIDARDGVTLGGQTWDGSPDGRPVGEWTEEPVDADGDAWRLALGAYDGVVVTWLPR